MNVGILTFHRSRNYGAFLQAYALCERLNSEPDVHAEIIDFQMRKEITHYAEGFSLSALRHPLRHAHDRANRKKQAALFAKDLERMRLSTPHVVSDSPDDFAHLVRGRYDAIVVGSDEVWKTNGFRGFPSPYWLLGDLGCRKFAYAASARNDFSCLPPDNQRILSDALAGFDFLGVRDALTQTEVAKFAPKEVPVHLCCDPTFLLDFSPDRENGRKLLVERFGVDTKKSVVGIMTENRTVSSAIRQRLPSHSVELVSLYQWQPACVDGSLLSPFEWVDVLSSLDLLVTSFFHAVCFAAKSGIPFLAFGTRGKASKVEEIVSMLGYQAAYFNTASLLLEQRFDSLLSNRLNVSSVRYNLHPQFTAGYLAMLGVLRKRFPSPQGQSNTPNTPPLL